MEVHRTLGPGFVELAYARAFERELTVAGLRFEREVAIPLIYKGEPLGVPFRADFVVEGVLVELKAIPCLGRAERLQVSGYLACGGFLVGLLLNFGAESLEFQRLTRQAAGNPQSSESQNPRSPEPAWRAPGLK